MITSGDIQFEPQQTKLVILTTSIVVQMAGDVSMQSEIILRAGADIGKRVEAEPWNWWNVSDVAELYRHYYQEARLRRAEHELLTPLGLDRNTWITRQQEMDSGLVRQLATELINYRLQPCAAIISGVDSTGPHIYVADNGGISCQDWVGFAAIGAGAGHANSQLMFAGHTRNKPIPETFLAVYFAKKRAEVAPGVGQATDMFGIGPKLGSYFPIPDTDLQALAAIYENEQLKHEIAVKEGRLHIYGWFKERFQPPTTETQAPSPPDRGGDAPSNQKEV